MSVEPEPFNVKPSHIILVLVIILLASALGGLLKWGYDQPTENVLPFHEEGVGPILNGAYYVSIIAIAGFAFYFMLRKGLIKHVHGLVAVAYGFMVFAVAAFYLPIFFWVIGLSTLSYSDSLQLIIMIGTVAFSIYAVFKRGGLLRFGVTLFLGSAVGAMLGFNIPTFSALMILLFLAAYDIFAVFYGPIGKIATEYDLIHKVGLTLTMGNLTLGLGDVVFYSMLAAHILIYFGSLPYLASTGGMLLGAYLTFKMLEKRRAFPGLPFTLVIAIAAALSVSVAIP